MMNKNNKNNKKGFALVFVVILITNAIIIISSIVFLAVMEKKSSGALSSTAKAFQQVDSGVEYILKKINDKSGSPSYTVENLCLEGGKEGDTFNEEGKCSIKISNDEFEVILYFLGGDKKVISDGEKAMSEVEYIRAISYAGENFNRVSRSLEVRVN